MSQPGLKSSPDPASATVSRSDPDQPTYASAAARQTVPNGICTRKHRPQGHSTPVSLDSATAGARLVPISRLSTTATSQSLATLFPFFNNSAKGMHIDSVCRINTHGGSASGCPTVPSASAWQSLTTCASRFNCNQPAINANALTLDPACVIRKCTGEWISATSSICLPLSAPALRSAGVYLSRLPASAAETIDGGNATAAALLTKHHTMVGASLDSLAADEKVVEEELGVCVPTLPVGSRCGRGSGSFMAPQVSVTGHAQAAGQQPLLSPAFLLSSTTPEAHDLPFPVLLRSIPIKSDNLSTFLTADNLYSLVYCDSTSHTLQSLAPPYPLSNVSITPRPLINADRQIRTDTPGTITAPAPASPDWLAQLIISIFLLTFLFGTYALKLYGPRIIRLWISLQRRATGAHTTTQRELVLKPACNQMLDDVGVLTSGEARARMSQARPGEVVDFSEAGGGVDEEFGVVVLEGVDALPRYMAPSVRSSVGSMGSLARAEAELGRPAPVYESLERQRGGQVAAPADSRQ